MSSEDLSGLGFHVHVENGEPKKVDYLFETTAFGQDVFCGVSMEFNPGAPLLTPEKYEEMAKLIEKDGLPRLGIAVGALKRITVEDYERDYREDEEEEKEGQA
ncbi:MAG: hypothetical protein ACYDHW_10880 [Syntrophorhabdaceae bacterium]